MDVFITLKKRVSTLFSKFRNASWKIKVVTMIAIFFIGWFGVKPMLSSNTADKPQYQTATVEKGTLITSVSATGSVSNGNGASISSSATGVVSEVYVTNGDYVLQGQNIATMTLDQASLQRQTSAWASYLSAQNSVNAAKSRMNGLQASLFQANQTFVNGAGTVNPDTDDPTYIIQKAQWQQSEADYTNQQGAIAAAEAALSSAWLSYAQTSAIITAPISGTITNLSIAPGTTITSNSSNTTTTTTASSQTVGTIKLEGGTPQAVVNLSEIDITKVKIGQKATLLLDAFSDKTFTGRVSAIDTTGSTSSGVTSYPVTISFDTGLTNIYPNMAVNATIITDITNNVVLVPSSAVQTTNGVSTVRIMNSGNASSVPVEIGKSNDTQTEITSGLTEGQIIVTGEIGGSGTTTTSRQSGSTGTSPFGVGGFGGANRTFGTGAGGGQRVLIQAR